MSCSGAGREFQQGLGIDGLRLFIPKRKRGVRTCRAVAKMRPEQNMKKTLLSLADTSNCDDDLRPALDARERDMLGARLRQEHAKLVGEALPPKIEALLGALRQQRGRSKE